MKIGVLSDTHGEVGATRQALEILDRLHVDLTIHCGDVGIEVIPLFHGRPAHFVHGNMDEPVLLREAITEPQHVLHDELGSLEVEGRRIAFLHGNDVQLLHHTIHSGHWDLVCHGHTHTFASSRHRQTVVLNPGALSRTNWPSVAVVDLPSLEVKGIPLEEI
ncbi:MAG: YfcE family phosphodiesterase [Planctomycetaceae bacterium]|nr:YfcE family phosphodiesterase [Planctomycetaceae bacterium]